MGINMKEMPGVEEVIIRSTEKEVHIRNAIVSEVNGHGIRVSQVAGVNEEVARERKEALLEKRLPSTYLWEGEDPKAALRRIMNDQLQVSKSRAGGPRVLSYYSPSDWYPGNSHWDLAIVYPVKLLQPVRRPPWWRVLGFVEKSRLRAKQFGWNADFVRDLGIVA